MPASFLIPSPLPLARAGRGGGFIEIVREKPLRAFPHTAISLQNRGAVRAVLTVGKTAVGVVVRTALTAEPPGRICRKIGCLPA